MDKILPHPPIEFLLHAHYYLSSCHGEEWKVLYIALLLSLSGLVCICRKVDCKSVIEIGNGVMATETAGALAREQQ